MADEKKKNQQQQQQQQGGEAQQNENKELKNGEFPFKTIYQDSSR